MPKSSSNGEKKVELLRKQGVLNPSPRDVIDELFQRHDFFDAHDLLQVKYEMLRRVKKDGWPVTQAAQVFGFSRPSLYKAKEAFEQRGLAGLVPRRRGPRAAHKLTEDVMRFTEQALLKDETLRSSDLADLVESRFGLKIHPRSIERALVRRGKK